MRVTLSMATAWWHVYDSSLSISLQTEGLKLRSEAMRDIGTRIQLSQVNETLVAGIAYLCCTYASQPLAKGLSLADWALTRQSRATTTRQTCIFARCRKSSVLGTVGWLFSTPWPGASSIGTDTTPSGLFNAANPC